MAKYVIEDTTLTNTANAIREKTGKTDTITPSNFATEIANIQVGGGSKVTKGIVINECDVNGYATDVSIVGMTEIPDGFCSYLFKKISSGDGFFEKIGSNLHLPNDLKVIYNDSFSYCDALALNELPDTITSIRNNSFYNCTNLALTKLPDNLCYIYSSAFEGCEKLLIKKIPVGVTEIPVAAFKGCTSLTEITCEGEITSIRDTNGYSGAFYNCTNLAKFALPNITNVPTLVATAFKSTPIASGTGYIYVPDTLVDSFKSATNWSTYADQIKPISELEASV